MKRIVLLSMVFAVCLLMVGCKETEISFSLTGQVRNLGNQGIQGVTVELREEGSLIETATTAANGVYVIESAKAKKDAVVDIQASLGDYSDSEQLVVSDAQPYLQDFTFPIPMGTIQIVGYVYDQDGNPFEGVAVDFLLGTKTVGLAYTDESGYFSMSGIGAVPGDVITINARFDRIVSPHQLTVTEQLFYVKDINLNYQQYPVAVDIKGKLFYEYFEADPEGNVISEMVVVEKADMVAYEVDSEGNNRFLKATYSNALGDNDFGLLTIKEGATISVVISKEGFAQREVVFDSDDFLIEKLINADLHLWKLYYFEYTYYELVAADLPVQVAVTSYVVADWVRYMDYFHLELPNDQVYYQYSSAFDATGKITFNIPVPYRAKVFLWSPKAAYERTFSLVNGQRW